MPVGGPGPGMQQPAGVVGQAPAPAGHFGSIDERGMKSLFGIPFSTLRDQEFERKALKVCGVAMVAGILFPYTTTPKTMFSWDMPSTWAAMIWPLIAGLVYAGIGFSPKQMIDKVPPIVLKWAPFLVSVLSIGFIGFSIFHMFKLIGGSLPWKATLYLWGYPVLVFGLMSMLMNPRDMAARLLIVVGAALCFFFGLDFLIDSAFRFKGSGIFGIVHNVLWTVIVVLSVASVLFVIKPEQVPALKAFDEFAPFITALFLLWLPLEVVLLTMEALVKVKGGALGDLLMGAHMLVVVTASFGILMLTAPEAYDTAKAAIEGGHARDFPGGQVPQQGMQQPPPGAYQPPQGGGYPPQGGGAPPQGGFPPQQPPGGGYPPQQ